MGDIPFACLDVDDEGGPVVLIEQSFRLLPNEQQNQLIDEWIHILLDSRAGQETAH